MTLNIPTRLGFTADTQAASNPALGGAVAGITRDHYRLVATCDAPVWRGALRAKAVEPGRDAGLAEGRAMRAQMLEVMQVMAVAIQSEEMAADGLMCDAEVLQACHPGVADALRTLGRKQRVNALELEGRLAAMRQEYVKRFQEEPEAGA